MHHFTKKIHQKLWYHLVLSLGSALVTVALFDTLCSLSWICKDYEIVAHYYTGQQDSTTPIKIMDIFYWIFVSYRMMLSIVICVGGIFMGRRIIVIVWLLVSLCIDLVHLSETTYILSKPNLVRTWPILVAISSCIWQELKIIRIKYRIIRRSLLVDANNNTGDDEEYEPETLQNEIKTHCNSKGKLHWKIVNRDGSFDHEVDDDIGSLSLIAMPLGRLYCKIEATDSLKENEIYKRKSRSDSVSQFVTSNAIHFIKLLRNLYNLLTWHFTGYLFGGDYLHLINSNNTAISLEMNFVRYARVFLDALTVIYIVQEKKLLMTPWIMAYIMLTSAFIAVFLFTLLYFNLLTTLFASIYYFVFSIDLFFRCSFLIFCIRYILKTKKIV